MTPLARDIAAFYDAHTPMWEGVWGEHLHHGHYGPDGRARKPPLRAQEDMIGALLAFGGVTAAERVLDAGCGVGGSARALARRLGCEVEGLTLSPVQAARGNARSAAEGLGDRVRLHVGDATGPPFPDGHFDGVWCLEAAEHFPDKLGFLRAFARVLRPGGWLLVATWCHRPTPPELARGERLALAALGRDYHLPPFVSVPDYARLIALAGFGDVRTADWTAAVQPFWRDVLRSALAPAGLAALARGGGPTVRAALATRHMIRGYRSGLIRFGVMAARKA